MIPDCIIVATLAQCVRIRWSVKTWTTGFTAWWSLEHVTSTRLKYSSIQMNPKPRFYYQTAFWLWAVSRSFRSIGRRGRIFALVTCNELAVCNLRASTNCLRRGLFPLLFPGDRLNSGNTSRRVTKKRPNRVLLNFLPYHRKVNLTCDVCVCEPGECNSQWFV